MSAVADAVIKARGQVEEARKAVDDAIAEERGRLTESLARRRERLGLTQQQVADAAGISRGQVANIERGLGLSVEALIGYAAAVGMRVTVGVES